MIEYLSDPVFMKFYFIVLLLLLFYVLIRCVCYGEQSNNIFSNNLIKYISNNEEKSHNYSSSGSKNCKNEKQSKPHKNSNSKKNGLDFNEEHAPLNNHINIDFMGESEFANSNNNITNENNSFENLSKAEIQEKEAKILRFAIDYCRASPNIHLKSRSILDIGWRSTKFHFDVDLELGNSFNYKENSIMTAVPINKALINFEDVMLKEGFVNLIQSFTHRNIMKNLHLDVLKNQNLMVKIQKFYENGSLKDVLFKSNPKKTYAQKYPNNTKGKPLHASLISLYGRQILEALHFLHSSKWYHLHLHSGNVLVDEKNQQIKITELENFICDLPLKNEQYFYFIYEEFNYDKNSNLPNGNNLKDYQNEKLNFYNNNNNLFSDIFKNQFNIFEKIDIISFGRILYEMTTGKELKSPFPDDLEYKDMDIEIAQILRAIFQRKNSKFPYNNQYKNNSKMSEITAADLLKLKFFDPENNNALINLSNKKGKNTNSDLKNNEDLDVSHIDDVSKLHLELDPNDANKSVFMSSSEQYCSGIKEKIFNQNGFLLQKIKLLNKFI